MRSVYGCTLALFAAGFMTPRASAQELTAREVFYAEEPDKPTPGKTSKPVSPPVRRIPKPNPPVSTPVPPKEPAHSAPPQEPAYSEPHQEPAYSVTLAKLSSDPLGLRATLLKQGDSGWVEVDRDAVFQPDDHVRINIETNDRGYLYVIDRQSSGIWKPMFPAPEIPHADNEVKPHVKYQIPQGYAFTIANPPGVEKLFVVLSRNPHLDMGSLPSELGHGQSDKLQTTYAMNRPIDDAMVNRMREMSSRDLIIEKVDDSTPGPQKEKAVYAVNVAGGADARVVLDIEIRHP